MVVKDGDRLSFEWKQRGKGKVPFFSHLRNADKSFLLADLKNDRFPGIRMVEYGNTIKKRERWKIFLGSKQSGLVLQKHLDLCTLRITDYEVRSLVTIEIAPSVERGVPNRLI